MIRDLDNEIRSVILEYAAAFLAGDVARAKALWDPEADDRIYVGAELTAPVVGRAALEAYYDGLMKMLVLSRGEVGDVRVRDLGDHLAYVVTHIDWTFSMSGQRVETPIRMTALLRRRGGRWRFIQMHESIRWQLPGA
jgi:uncharacterized protein (TIGR02246 family)